MSKPINTPFSEYREEQVKVNIFDYFVEPSFFERLCDAKAQIISGARGTGKTTILKALCVSEIKDPDTFFNKNDYIGVYYRVDLNVTASFQGEGLSFDKWSKLFSYYFAAKMSYEIITQVIKLREYFSIENEKEICTKYGLLFCKDSSATRFEELKKIVYLELFKIRDYINNCAYEKYPHIGDYTTIITELPKDIILSSTNAKMKNKTFFYLVDEFEGLYEWQQKTILSFMKFSDIYHTFKICMRPDGIKTAETIGNEYIRETDDVTTIDLNELILEKKEDYYKYALDVCKRRMALFYEKNNLKNPDYSFEELFEEISDETEFENIFNSKAKDIEEEIGLFIRKEKITDKTIIDYLYDHFFDFYIIRLLYFKNQNKKSIQKIFESVINKDNTYTNAIGNYGVALLYYLCLKYSINKVYSGFKTLVNISGGTLRYLLELCNEIFERAEKFSYEKPKKISAKTQTEVVSYISAKRLNQISVIPQIGLNMRTFVISLGNIYRIFHRDDMLAKFEPNHFSIKASTSNKNENVQFFLKECVMRGVLLKRKNNKNKTNDKISSDEYIYILHPIYTPSFKISWRIKQKAEFDIDEIDILIGNDIKEINGVISKYEKKYLRDDSKEEQVLLKLEEGIR